MSGKTISRIRRSAVAAVSASGADLFAGGGEMGALMRATDWSNTRLGPIESWPRSLKTMLGVVLGSRFPMLLWWGPDLLHLYNDAYRPILRDKHPASLAAPAAEIWAEVWDVAGPMARGVQQGGPATWIEDLQLFINSGGMAEETYFTFSYSPVPGDDGRVGGLLNTVQETTAKVQSERQIRMLHDLAARATEARTEDEAYRIAVEVLSANELDLPFALLYRLDENAEYAELVGGSGWKEFEADARHARVPLDHDAADAWPFVEIIRAGHELVIDNLSSRFGTPPVGRWNARPEQAIVLPFARAGQATPYAFLVGGVSPHRALDDRYRRFFRAAADQVASLVANARAYEAETRRAEALAEIDRAKTQFFNNISHEFRTPLTLLLGPVDDALSDREHPLPGVHHQRLELAHHNALRLLRLVNALLDFSRHEAGRQKAVFAPTDLAQLTRELASQFRSATDRAGLELNIACDALSEPAYVDRDMWEKVVLNLVSNAFKFTAQGAIGVRLAEVGDVFQLTVSDTGTGIAPGELPLVFQRFHRVVGAWSRTHEGSGIGLALVQELVKLHGGDITVQSRRGEGSYFNVSIPKGKSHLPADAIAPTESAVFPSHQAGVFAEEAARWLASGEASPVDGEVGAPAVAESLNGARARILLVDDNADLRAYVSRVLAPYYEVRTAVDGQAALEAIQADPPDLVLSDVMMPRLDGFGLIRALRADPATRRICVILLSARAGDDAVAEGVEALADDYVSKPFAVRELVARIRTHLELARTRKRWVDDLEQANRELETFSYSVAHDLRAPLRTLEGFGKMLVEDYGSKLDENGHRYLSRIQSGAARMNELIEDLLKLSQQTHGRMMKEPVDVAAIARSTIDALRVRDPARQLDAKVEDGLTGVGDVGLITIALENLLGNAWKFSSQRAPAQISVGKTMNDGVDCFYVRDNGAGFDMAHARNLFAPFQRLHSESAFEGTGIGLFTVHRIISRHGGRIWAEAEPGRGAKFYFTLGKESESGDRS